MMDVTNMNRIKQILDFTKKAYLQHGCNILMKIRRRHKESKLFACFCSLEKRNSDDLNFLLFMV